MGSSFSAIEDDKEQYECWCLQLNTKMKSLYGTHYRWVKATVYNETSLTLGEWENNAHIDELTAKMANLKTEIATKQAEYNQTRDELAKMIGVPLGVS